MSPLHLTGRRQFLSFAVGGAAAFALPGTRAADEPATQGLGVAEPLHWRERILLGFGTTLWLRAAHANATRADTALTAAVAAIRRIEAQMSLFDPHSALSRLNRDGVLHDPPPELLAVLRLARNVASRSDGAFDVTVQPLMAAWQLAQRAGRAASATELRRAQALVGWRHVELTQQRVRLRQPGMALTLNGIAQGYAADSAKAALRQHGVKHALLDTGEWAALGQAPDAQPWMLGVADPRGNAAAPLLARLRDDGRAIATSSDAHTTYSADRRDHHIIDPRSARSPRELASVTVVAPSCALADALTKVVFMAGWQGALPLARRWGVDVLVVNKAGRWRASAGLALHPLT